jgi:hypothetical protein
LNQKEKTMKRRIALSIALALGVALLSLISSDSTAKAQPGRTFVADTGVVTLGPNQILRITVANELDQTTVRFRGLQYLDGTCTGGVCKHIISSQSVTNPLTLAPGEAASYNLGDTATHEVRGVVTSNRQSAKVLFQIINTTTGEVVSAWGASEIDLKA